MKPCPNFHCPNPEQLVVRSVTDRVCISCVSCHMSGPHADNTLLATEAWNALGRIAIYMPQIISRKQLSSRQKTVFDFIYQHIITHGYAPTLREICDGVEISSTNGVNDHLVRLARKHYLLWGDDSKARNLRLIQVKQV